MHSVISYYQRLVLIISNYWQESALKGDAIAPMNFIFLS